MSDRQLRARIVRHARSGSLDRAEALLADYAASYPENDPAVALLAGRLLKERAKRAPPEKAATLFAEASSLYEAAASADQLSYPLINAATLALLAGDAERCETLARRVVVTLEALPDEAETPYWKHATRAEALLLLGRDKQARDALEAALTEAPEAWEDHAVTIGQFALICTARNIPTDWLDSLRPPRSLHFAGIMNPDLEGGALKARIAELLERERIGFGFGALAAGSDILVADCLRERGARLHVVLPCPADAFRMRSVAPAGDEWLQRFDRLIDAATSVEELQGSALPDPPAVDLAEQVAQGMAIQNARVLQSEARSLRIRDAGRDSSRDDAPGMHVIHASSRGQAAPSVPREGTLVCLVALGDDAPVSLHESPAAALAEILAAADPGQPVAADYRYQGDGSGGAASQLVSAIRDTAEAGQVLLSKPFAMALLAQKPESTVAPFGELRSAEGVVDLFQLG